MQGQLNVWDSIANYKKCRKKFYEIHVCMPPKNTIVINKLEQYDTYVALGKKDHFTADEIAKMKISNPQMLSTLQNLVSQGKAYAVTQNTPFVLAGTIGEMWCISPDKLAQTYMFLQGGQPVAINQQSLQSRMKNGLMDWTLIRTSQQAQQGVNMACFVPTAKKGQIKTSWGSLLNINGAGVPHGKGDFVLCDMLPNGQPNLANRWVVNGEVFANTYDNHGWSDCLNINNTNLITINNLPNLVTTTTSSRYKSLFDKLCNILETLKRSAVQQMPFNYNRVSDDVVQVKPSVIEDYVNKVSSSNKANTDLSIRQRQQSFSHFLTQITVKDDKLQFKSYNTFDGGHQKNLTYMFELPANDLGIQEFQNKVSIYGGLLGWIPNGIQNCFAFSGKPTKYEHDGIHAYTVSSSGMNRKLRLQDYESDTNHRGYERIGAESQRLYRAIDGADKYFDKVVSTKPLTVFRGMPGSDAVKFSGRNSIDNLSGGTITNTAYTSSTLNLHSTLMFAKTNTDPNDGVILAINIPSGINADYIHNIAGWKEQFEVLWDRKYDIQVGEKILSFKGGSNFTYHVFNASIVAHVPMQPIPSFIDVSHHLNIPNINLYDKNGRINFDYEAIKGTMLEAFDILKKKGVSGMQYQNKLGIDPMQRDYIVVHAGDGDDDTVVDLGFTYNTDTKMIDVVKFISKKRVQYKNDDGYDVTATVRNYWSDWNRNGGAIDQNFSWESYNANDKGFDVKSGNFAFQPKSSITVKSPHKGSSNYGQFWQEMDIIEDLPNCIAYSILEYVKYNKDVTLLPMQDVARYFDSVFKNTILNEGYELKDSMPVNRVGKETDENDGYVPLKYRIDGDNDDSLTIMMRMSRDSNGKLQLEYRGASNNNKVRESDILRWNIFNQTVMEKECNKILYIFASKLNLNHTRKADQLMRFISSNRGFVITRANDVSDVKKERNIHEKGSHKLYRIWYPNKRDNIKVTLDYSNEQYNYYLHSNKNQVSSFSLNYKLPILELYRTFISNLTDLEAQ